MIYLMYGDIKQTNIFHSSFKGYHNIILLKIITGYYVIEVFGFG